MTLERVMYLMDRRAQLAFDRWIDDSENEDLKEDYHALEEAYAALIERAELRTKISRWITLFPCVTCDSIYEEMKDCEEEWYQG